MLKNKKYILILIGLFALSLGLLGWVIRPAVKNIKENNDEISYQKEKLAKLLQEGQSVLENQKNLSLVKTNIQSLSSVWLRVGEELKFITDLEQAAAENNLEQVIYFDNTQGNDEIKIKVIPLELQITGELNNIMSYINALEALDYYINIDKVIINASLSRGTKRFSQQVKDEGVEETEQSVTNLSVRLNGLTYWQ